MTPKPLIPIGIEAFKLEESANDNHYAASFLDIQVICLIRGK